MALKPDFKDSATLGLFVEDGITAPGGIQIPVCSAREALAQLGQGV
ncbi:hypothetical protein V494_06639, partial [Pseudogymnoascus sp. VKM F-4513 (FW-928)]